MLKVWRELGVLAGRSPDINLVFAQHAVVGRSVRVHLDPLLLVETAKGTVGWEGGGVVVILAPLERRPPGDTASDNTGHGSSRPEGRVRTGTCVAS